MVTVELGKPGEHAFVPNKLRFETGKLYKLVLKNPSNDPHYFTSHAFSQMIFTRKVQVTQVRDGKTVNLADTPPHTHPPPTKNNPQTPRPHPPPPRPPPPPPPPHPQFKGAIREIEVYPGSSAEWWFVPVATGKVTDLRCGISGSDGKTHADHGMVGEIVIE